MSGWLWCLPYAPLLAAVLIYRAEMRFWKRRRDYWYESAMYWRNLAESPVSLPGDER